MDDYNNTKERATIAGVLFLLPKSISGSKRNVGSTKWNQVKGFKKVKK